jgi:uncharacterized membrane protein YccF (DUF307 family)
MVHLNTAIGWLIAAMLGFVLVVVIVVNSSSRSADHVVIQVSYGPTVVSTQVVPLR